MTCRSLWSAWLTRSVAVLSLLTLALTGNAQADPLRCQRGILKASEKHALASMRTIVKCEERKLQGTLPGSMDCTVLTLPKDELKLRTSIAKACGGSDKNCATPADDDLPASIAWPATCPDFEGKGCTNGIDDCDDIATCLACVTDAAVDQAVTLYYGDQNPSAPGSGLNRCQIAIGKATAKYFAARTRALGKCWSARYAGKHANACPSPGDGKAAGAIAKAEAKKVSAITKACGGLTVNDIGFASQCPGVAGCATAVTDVASLTACVDCVTDFKVDCLVPLAVPTFAPYPSACVDVVTPTPTVTSMPGLTATPTVTVTPTPTVTASPTLTATPTPTFTASPTPTVSPTPNCGDGVIASPAESCDPPGSATCPNAGNGLEICNASCRCNCPGTFDFEGNAAHPSSLLDTGFTGIAHDSVIVSEGKITFDITACPSAGPGNTTPCGVCNFTGPIPNPDADNGDIDNRRCTNDTSIQCTNNTPCLPSGTCQYFFGSNLPLVAGAVAVCVNNEIAGTITGTANIETGESGTVVSLISHVFTGLQTDKPCPTCVGDATPNDGIRGGTCSGAGTPRDGLACDANGVSPVPAFGSTSLDCPPLPGANIANLDIPIVNSTGTETRTLSTANPMCTDAPGKRCFCDTCNNANAEACGTNADCPPSGGDPGVCGGRRCIGGLNAGAPCSVASSCPSGACGRPGQATKPNSCLGDCVDTAPIGDNEGECVDGPVDQNCAPPEDFRGCSGPSDCPLTNSCLASNRECFLGNAVIGSELRADGAPSAPVNGTSTPTVASLFCVASTGSAAVNSASGLPGPARLTLSGFANVRP